jgi:hypothetical protein
MKSYMLFFLLIAPFFCLAQVFETFSDGNFTQNPTWTGTTSNFIVNNAFELQSAAQGASASYLFTSSAAIQNSVWECRLKIDYPTSSSNYACMYIISDVNVLGNGLKGYFVQVGGANDEVSLYVQDGTQKIKIIDGVDKRTDGKPLEIRVKVTRDSLSVFRLYSKLPSETEYFPEGEVQNSKVLRSKYVGLSFTNSATTGNCYYFDEIQVSGSIIPDQTSPELTYMKILSQDRLRLNFSEPVDFSDFQLTVNGESCNVNSLQIADNQESVEFVVDIEFQTGRPYQIEVIGLKDEAGNALHNNRKVTGLTEPLNVGDVVFNEVMFHQADSAAEYIEFHNRSGKVIDLSGMVFTTLKSDGSLNSGNKIQDETLIFPGGYLAVTSDTMAVRKHHDCPFEAKLIQSGWSNLNNESSTLVLTNSTKDTIIDSFSYDVSMHHVLVKNSKGVALERINPDWPVKDANSWHSAASSHNFGTPGFVNSQYRSMDELPEEGERSFYLESTVFSPDNDGNDDVCILHYNFPETGNVFNICILTPAGEKVFSLAEQFISGQEGVLTWDGRNRRGQLTNIGVYVFYIEIFNPNTGKRKCMKLPVVLSSR